MSRRKPDRVDRPDPAHSTLPGIPRDGGHSTGAAARRTYLVEHYWPGVTEEAFRAAVGRVREASDELSRGGKPIHYLHSTFVPGDESALCVFAATSARLVRQAYAQAGVRFERIVLAVEIDPVQSVAARREAPPTS